VLVGFEVLTAVFTKGSVLWDITWSSPLRVNCCFGRTRPLHFSGSKNKLSKKPASLSPTFIFSSCSAYSLTLKTEATCSSETLVNVQQTTQHYIPHDRPLQARCLYCFTKSMHLNI
jgi:hypothetical protein